jgi:hypothetical protein
LPDGRILISDWSGFDPPQPGVVHILASDGAPQGRLDMGRPLGGPADFALDSARGEIWLPVMRDGVVVIAKTAP